jgi:spermidine synthase
VTRWLHETLAPGLRRSWLLDEMLWAGDTGFQQVVIARTAQGVALFCDGERQSTELGQLAYHEALLVPALLLAERVERVLVVGSSEGVVSQLAVAAGAATVDHVDIDRECVRRCAELLPYGYDAAELAAAERGDGPVRVHYADGWDFVARASGFDVVVVDLPDERDGQAAQHNRLYGVEFLRRCARAVRGGGVVASQAGCPALWRNAGLLRVWQRFHSVFGTVVYYGSDEHEWAFLSARPDSVPDPVPDPVPGMADRLATLPYRPATLDAHALLARTLPPMALRRATPTRDVDNSSLTPVRPATQSIGTSGHGQCNGTGEHGCGDPAEP